MSTSARGWVVSSVNEDMAVKEQRSPEPRTPGNENTDETGSPDTRYSMGEKERKLSEARRIVACGEPRRCDVKTKVLAQDMAVSARDRHDNTPDLRLATQ